MHRLRYIGMDELGFRNMWISLGIGLPVMMSGGFLLRHHETAGSIFVMVSFVLMIMLRHALDDRRRRQLEKDRASRRHETEHVHPGAL